MQRQSLGSPGRTSLILSSPNDVVSSDDSKRRESSSSSSSSPVITSFSDEIKPDKPLKCRHHHHQPEKFIHFIPLLMLLCFFILYLSSHDPSPSDLAQFNGFFKHPEKIIDSTDIDEIGRLNNENKSLKRSGVFAIRNLQEEIPGDNNNNNNYNDDNNNNNNITSQKSRKLGDF